MSNLNLMNAGAILTASETRNLTSLAVAQRLLSYLLQDETVDDEYFIVRYIGGKVKIWKSGDLNWRDQVYMTLSLIPNRLGAYGATRAVDRMSAELYERIDKHVRSAFFHDEEFMACYTKRDRATRQCQNEQLHVVDWCDLRTISDDLAWKADNDLKAVMRVILRCLQEVTYYAGT